ncbi:hypothetical protein DICVIV_08666 [Dictyocaulus viviparus]|uniref:DUF7774 domain-containing protein n=1 Tax=Dictyocaulus viviparus TaxID=29172 RepID=A0A0D8XL83_DICVI|nr:hypothetical protein DICVIV_08666 [Dictyocaulus viviparus]
MSYFSQLRNFMSHDPRQSRKLREMFRLFQRQRRDDDCDEKVEEKAVRPRRISSNSASESRARAYRRKSATWLTEPTTAVTVDDTDASNPTGKSASEMKRELIRMKYGLQEKDQEFYRKNKDEEMEEFENVNAVARPAATKMRTAKLKWKKKDADVSLPNDKGTQKCPSESSDDFGDDGIEAESQDNARVAEIKRRAGVNKTASSEQNESASELKVLLIRIEELEMVNRKLVLQMKRMKNLLYDREKKIEELSSLVSFLQKSGTEEQENKPTGEQEAIAIRGLEIMKRNQLLEHSVRNTERTILSKFFEASDSKPTQSVRKREYVYPLKFNAYKAIDHGELALLLNLQVRFSRKREYVYPLKFNAYKAIDHGELALLLNLQIVMLIDKALSYAIEVILMRPDRFDDFVDNELRTFLLDTQKAKRILLDVMLLHPEYVPRAWSGDVMVKRQREARQNVMDKQNHAASRAAADLMRTQEYATSLDDDRNDAKTCKQATPSALANVRVRGSSTAPSAKVVTCEKDELKVKPRSKESKSANIKNANTSADRKGDNAAMNANASTKSQFGSTYIPTIGIPSQS